MESRLMFDVKTLRVSLESAAAVLQFIEDNEILTKYNKGRLSCMNEIIETIKAIEEANKE